MLKRHLWLGLLGFLVGAAWACAQTQAPTFSLWDLESPPLATPPKTDASPPPTSKAESDAPEQRLYAPEIWRLPPTNSAAVGPAALNMPAIETIPGPASAPMANAPAALSGVLSCPEPLKLKSSQPDKLWDGSFDLGMDGSEGNSEAFNFRFGFHAKRKTVGNVFTLSVDYNRSTAQTVAIANRLFFEGRDEWLIGESRWSWFLHETVEYDEFQSFNVQDASDIGLGYQLIKTDATTLVGRFGGGFSHEYGGPDNGQFTPEAVFGGQFEWHLSKRQKLLGLVEYAPSVTDFQHYRLRSQAALDILLDAEKNLSLRIGVLELYNSVPNGARPNDFDYAMTLLWKF